MDLQRVLDGFEAIIRFSLVRMPDEHRDTNAEKPNGHEPSTEPLAVLAVFHVADLSAGGTKWEFPARSVPGYLTSLRTADLALLPPARERASGAVTTL